MDVQMTRGEQNLLLFQRLIPKNERIYVWCCRPDGAVVASSCPKADQKVLEETFRRFEGVRRLAEYAKASDRKPLLVSSLPLPIR